MQGSLTVNAKLFLLKTVEIVIHLNKFFNGQLLWTDIESSTRI